VGDARKTAECSLQQSKVESGVEIHTPDVRAVCPSSSPYGSVRAPAGDLGPYRDETDRIMVV